MTTTEVVLLVVAVVLVPVAGVFAAADSAISSVSAARVEELRRAGRRGARSLAPIVADRTGYVNLLVMLRLTAEITATILVAVAMLARWGFRPWVPVGVIVVMLLVSYVVIGVLPRTIGHQYPYTVAVAVAAPIRAAGVILAPIARMLVAVGRALTPGSGVPDRPFATDVELREMVALAGDRGVVDESERDMLQSVFNLGDTIVREVMVPRTEVVWIESSKTLRQAVHLADRSGFSRIPVIGEDIDDVVGVVYVKDMIVRLLSLADDDRGPKMDSMMRPAVFVPESKNVDQLLREMQLNRTHVAMVVDEYGGMAGIVTMEDIVEEIVGEITDEYDPDTPDPMEHLDDGAVRVSAKLPVETLGQEFGVELPGDDVETVGGLLAQLLGRVALPGAEVDYAGLHLVAEGGVDRRGRHRVMTLCVTRQPPSDDQPDEDHPDPEESTADPDRTTEAEKANT